MLQVFLCFYRHLVDNVPENIQAIDFYNERGYIRIIKRRRNEK